MRLLGDGQLNLESIMKLLPGEWQILFLKVKTCCWRIAVTDLAPDWTACWRGRARPCGSHLQCPPDR